MKTKKELAIEAMKIVFGFMLLGVIAFFLGGEALMPRENPTISEEVTIVDSGWERVFEDGARMKIEVPGRCQAKRNEIVRLERVLPENQDEVWFCMRASQQDMRVYVGEELRQEYSTKETRLFGKNSASAFVFFKVDATDAGKVLAIELVSDSEYSGFLNEVYAGGKYDIVRIFIKECGIVLLVSVLMLVVSSVAVCIGFVLRLVYKRSADITYLGMGLWLLSLTMLAESRVRQFFLPNASIASHVGFLLTILLPYPFLEYVNRIQKGRYKKIYGILSLCVAMNFVGSVLLQVFGIVDLGESSFVSYGMIILMVAMIAITIAMDFFKKKVYQYKELTPGLVAMLAVSVWEIYVNLVPETPFHGGVMLSFGLILLLAVAGFKTARDMMAIEKEKQEALVASEAKAMFLANMSHEIRTPINTIIGMNEMVLRESKDEDITEYAQNVQNASRLLLGLINDILDFSKVEAGKLDILETEYSLPKTLADVLHGFRLKAESKNLKLEADIEETLPSVLLGDEIRIRQILNNLLSNAVKYTAEGSITFSVKGIRDEKGFSLFVSVKDTGRGIREEDRERLFDSFQRLEEGASRHIEGTGLGLNIAKQLLDLMGGSISVESEYGKGSCFMVQIPQTVVDEAAMGRIEEAYKAVEKEKDKKGPVLCAPDAKVLVVDDSDMNLSVIKALLKRTGIQLDMAKGGMECMGLCQEKSYDLILMDHMMPEPDGIETLHMLREDESNPNRETAIVVLTANAIAGAAEYYMSEGFADYLSKPVTYEDLEEMLRKHLPADKVQMRSE